MKKMNTALAPMGASFMPKKIIQFSDPAKAAPLYRIKSGPSLWGGARGRVFLGIKLLFVFLNIVLMATACTKKEENSKSLPPPTLTFNAVEAPAEIKVTGFLMQGEKLLKMKENGEGDEVTVEITLTDGTKVSKDGKIVFPDGRKAALPSGSLIQMDGKMQGTDSLIPDEATVKGFQMKDGKMISMMKDGKTAPMGIYMRLKNGATVENDGTIMKKDGTHDTLKEGSMVLVDGTMVK